MKKLLAVLLGALLVALAVPVYAATDLSFSGGYTLMHNIHDNYGRVWDRDLIDGQNESWFRHRFNLKLTFQATDDIKVVWQIRAPHWGNWGEAGVAGRYNAQTRYFYAEITQSWGTFQVGRLSDGAPGIVGGLATLGHGPSWGSGNYLYAGGGVFNAWNDVTDGINYNVQLDNGFGFAAYYYKMSDGGEFNHTVDNDVERWGIEPRYVWDGGGATLGFVWVRNMANVYTFVPSILDPFPTPFTAGYTNLLFDYEDARDYIGAVTNNPGFAGNIYLYGIDPKDSNIFVVNPAIAQSWGPFSIGFEAAFAWGKNKYVAIIDDDTSAAVRYNFPFETDLRGFGLYADATYNYGAGDISFLAWYADGTDWDSDDDFQDVIGLGDFAPFLVAFGYNSIGAGDDGYSLNNWAYQGFFPGGNHVSPDAMLGTGSNQWGIGLLGNHSITDDIALNWGIGYFALVQPYYVAFADGTWWGNPSKDLGWEIDLGAKFNLLDNLTFETQFGYFFNGDAFDTYGDFNNNGVDDTSWHHAKDTFAWLNVLAVSF